MAPWQGHLTLALPAAQALAPAPAPARARAAVALEAQSPTSAGRAQGFGRWRRFVPLAASLFSRRALRARGSRSLGVRRVVTTSEPPTVQEEAQNDGEVVEEVAQMLQETVNSTTCPLSRRLKDVVFVKEMRDAITSGEFAISLSGAKLAATDYQSLCSRLHVMEERLERKDVGYDVLPPLEAQQCLRTVKSISEQLEHRILRSAASGADANAAEASAQKDPELSVDPPDLRQWLYIREDRTVDVDGVLGEASKAAKFSRDLWERLNGGHASQSKRQKDSESEEARQKRGLLEIARRQLEEVEAKRKHFLGKAAGKLNKASTKGTSGLRQLRAQLRSFDEDCSVWRGWCRLRSIEWCLQRCADEIERDLTRTGMSEWALAGPQLKLLVAEFSLLEKQASSYEQLAAEHAEELTVLEIDATRFAARLGIETEEKENHDLNSSLRRLVGHAQRALERAKGGLEFYSTGAQLLWQDVQYAGRLLAKAAVQNYTLKPLETRTMQRTAKDLATLIPFLIILIIPLSPVGHVLVFSFIQKNFPEFFPSSFTEQRQNAMKIYRDIAPETGEA
ncbi:unnamed protein product [Effrenium voratum]|nr:unnamed protein product [Effrenium voratum]